SREHAKIPHNATFRQEKMFRSGKRNQPFNVFRRTSRSVGEKGSNDSSRRPGVFPVPRRHGSRRPDLRKKQETLADSSGRDDPVGSTVIRLQLKNVGCGSTDRLHFKRNSFRGSLRCRALLRTAVKPGTLGRRTMLKVGETVTRTCAGYTRRELL